MAYEGVWVVREVQQNQLLTFYISPYTIYCYCCMSLLLDP